MSAERTRDYQARRVGQELFWGGACVGGAECGRAHPQSGSVRAGDDCPVGGLMPESHTRSIVTRWWITTSRTDRTPHRA